jgi:hypothetical protein
VAGQRDPRVLARHRHRRVKASEDDIVKALTGNWREEHLFVLGQALAMYDDITRPLQTCSAKLDELLAERGAANVDIGKAPKAGSKSRLEFDARSQARQEGLLHAHPRCYVDQGQQHDEEVQRQRSIAALRRRATALGFQINPVLASA